MRKGSAFGVLAFLLVAGCGQSDPPVMQSGVTATAAPEPVKQLGTEMAGDDVFHVGVDVAAGTWHTDGPRETHDQHFSDGRTAPVTAAPCTWAVGHQETSKGELLFTPDGDPHRDRGPSNVTIPAGSDFLSENCRTWHLVKPS